MDTDRTHVTHGEQAKDFIIHTILEAKGLACLCPGSLRPNSYKGKLERVKWPLPTEWVSLQEGNPEVSLLGSHIRTAYVLLQWEDNISVSHGCPLYRYSWKDSLAQRQNCLLTRCMKMRHRPMRNCIPTINAGLIPVKYSNFALI